VHSTLDATSYPVGDGLRISAPRDLNAHVRELVGNAPGSDPKWAHRNLPAWHATPNIEVTELRARSVNWRRAIEAERSRLAFLDGAHVQITTEQPPPRDGQRRSLSVVLALSAQAVVSTSADTLVFIRRGDDLERLARLVAGAASIRLVCLAEHRGELWDSLVNVGLQHRLHVLPRHGSEHSPSRDQLRLDRSRCVEQILQANINSAYSQTPVDLSPDCRRLLATDPRVRGAPGLATIPDTSLTVVVCAFQLDSSLQEFIAWNQGLFERLATEVVVVSDRPHEVPLGWRCEVAPCPSGVFSLTRAVNVGVRRANGGLVLKTDIDMVFNEFQLRDMRLRCRRGRPVVYRTYASPDRTPDLFPYIRRPVRPGAFGGGICMHHADWARMRGMNEMLEGYNSDDKEMLFALRREYGSKLQVVRHPAMHHLAHPRNRNRALNPRTPPWGKAEWESNWYRNSPHLTELLWGTGQPWMPE